MKLRLWVSAKIISVWIRVRDEPSARGLESERETAKPSLSEGDRETGRTQLEPSAGRGDDGGGHRERRGPGRLHESRHGRRRRRCRWSRTGGRARCSRSHDRSWSCSLGLFGSRSCSYEPFCYMGDRPILSELRPEVPEPRLLSRGRDWSFSNNALCLVFPVHAELKRVADVRVVRLVWTVCVYRTSLATEQVTLWCSVVRCVIFCYLQRAAGCVWFSGAAAWAEQTMHIP